MASSGPLQLTVDVGNSRLKACLFAEGSRVPVACIVCEGPAGAAELSAWLEGRDVGAAALSSVAGPGSYAALVGQLASRIGGPLLAPPDPGLLLDLESPETVGHDRLFAAVGALARVEQAVIVIDAGTALTVDAVLAPERVEARGVFLGGAIAPGPRLLALALAQGGAQLLAVSPHPAAPALGRCTRAALEAGIAVGFAGAAAELVRRLRLESGLAEAPVVLTGGARAFLIDVLPGALVVEHLVHEGLLERLRARDGA